MSSTLSFPRADFHDTAKKQKVQIFIFVLQPCEWEMKQEINVNYAHCLQNVMLINMLFPALNLF